MKTVFLKGPHLSFVAVPIAARMLGRVKKIKTADSGFQKSVDETIKINPDKIIFFGHGDENGGVQILRDGAGDESHHPVGIERMIFSGVSSKSKAVKLKIIEVYGCSIGAGIDDENLANLHATREDVGRRDLPSPKLRNAELYSEINPAVTYILNAGHNLTVVAPDLSKRQDNLFEVILDKIIKQSETFKVVKKRSTEEATKVFIFSAPKPKTPDDLSDENIKRFLIEKIENAASFYAANYEADGILKAEDQDVLRKYLKKVEKLKTDELNALKLKYLKIEVGRGKTKYIDFYISSLGRISEYQINRFLILSVMHSKVQSLQYFIDKYNIKSFSYDLFDAAAEAYKPFSCLQLLCQKSGYSPALKVALNSRYFSANSIESLKTIAMMVVYGSDLPKDEVLEQISRGGKNFMPIYHVALHIRNLVTLPGEGRVNALAKSKSELLNKLLNAIDQKQFGKFEGFDGSKDSLVAICSRLREGIDSKAAVVADSIAPRDSGDDDSDLETLDGLSGSESDIHGLEGVVDLRMKEAEIFEIGNEGAKKIFLYIPEESESGNSIWQGTDRRNNFRLVREEFLEYDEVRDSILKLILRAADKAKIEGRELLEAISYARKNGGMSHKYNIDTKKYERNTDHISDKWRLFSKTFQTLTKADNILSSRADLGLRLTFVPLSIVKDLERRLMVGDSPTSPFMPSNIIAAAAGRQSTSSSLSTIH